MHTEEGSTLAPVRRSFTVRVALGAVLVMVLATVAGAFSFLTHPWWVRCSDWAPMLAEGDVVAARHECDSSPPIGAPHPRFREARIHAGGREWFVEDPHRRRLLVGRVRDLVIVARGASNDDPRRAFVIEARDARSGLVRWQSFVPRPGPQSSSTGTWLEPHAEMIAVLLHAPRGTRVYGLGLEGGETRWDFEVAGRLRVYHHGDDLVFATASEVIAVSPEGEVRRWSRPRPGALSCLGDVGVEPAIDAHVAIWLEGRGTARLVCTRVGPRTLLLARDPLGTSVRVALLGAGGALRYKREHRDRTAWLPAESQFVRRSTVTDPRTQAWIERDLDGRRHAILFDTRLLVEHDVLLPSSFVPFEAHTWGRGWVMDGGSSRVYSQGAAPSLEIQTSSAVVLAEIEEELRLPPYRSEREEGRWRLTLFPRP